MKIVLLFYECKNHMHLRFKIMCIIIVLCASFIHTMSIKLKLRKLFIERFYNQFRIKTTLSLNIVFKIKDIASIFMSVKSTYNAFTAQVSSGISVSKYLCDQLHLLNKPSTHTCNSFYLYIYIIYQYLMWTVEGQPCIDLDYNLIKGIYLQFRHNLIKIRARVIFIFLYILSALSILKLNKLLKIMISNLFFLKIFPQSIKAIKKKT